MILKASQMNFFNTSSRSRSPTAEKEKAQVSTFLHAPTFYYTTRRL